MYTVIGPCLEDNARLCELLAHLKITPENSVLVRRAEELEPVRGRKILFAIPLDPSGLNLEWFRMVEKIRQDRDFFRGSVGCVLVDGASELYTKSVGRELVFTCNQAGCTFPGRPLTEGTGSLHNYDVTAKLWNTGLEEAYRRNAADMLERLSSFEERKHRKPKLLVLHASVRKTSNTFQLWSRIREKIGDRAECTELSLRNGEIYDCGGCPFTMCMHFSEKGQCYYGGVMVEQVYPAVEACDALILLCPNYNDAVSANISAFINRLTALYRRRQFYDKYLFGIIVSGYSGGDILAEQLISSLNMNKTFILPAHFAMIETANDPGSIRKVEGIEDRSAAFAEHILEVTAYPETAKEGP